MTDYSNMSDYEINWQVAFHIGLRTVELAEKGVFEPCNNPADAWPIIVSNKINIRFGAEGMACEAQFIQYGYDSVECYHANPLRASMIVFLMIKEAGNV